MPLLLLLASAAGAQPLGAPEGGPPPPAAVGPLAEPGAPADEGAALAPEPPPPGPPPGPGEGRGGWGRGRGPHGPRGLRGPGPGGPGGGAWLGGLPGQGAARLLFADRALERHRREFDAAEAERQQLLDELARRRAEYDPARISAGSVLERQALDRVLEQLQRNAERDRRNTEQAARLLKLIAAGHAGWRAWAADAPTTAAAAGGAPAAGGAARARWGAASAALERRDAAAFATTLLGERLGPVALGFAEEALDGPALGELIRLGHGGALPPRGLRLGEAGRQRILNRIDRIERRVDELAAETAQQKQELTRLRRLLTPPEPGPEAQPPARSSKP